MKMREGKIEATKEKIVLLNLFGSEDLVSLSDGWNTYLVETRAENVEMDSQHRVLHIGPWQIKASYLDNVVVSECVEDVGTEDGETYYGNSVSLYFKDEYQASGCVLSLFSVPCRWVVWPWSKNNL